jgi:hypothetical protein
VKDADDEYSDRKWEDMVVEEWLVIMEKEEKMVSLVMVVMEAQWEKSQMKVNPSQESQQTHGR